MIAYRREVREVVFSTSLVAGATALAFAPDAYLPMLARAFLVQWGVAFAAVALLAVWRRRWWVALGGALSAVLAFVQVQAPEDAMFSSTDGPVLRIAHMNVLQPNMEHAAAVERALESDADVISVQEVGPEWAGDLAAGLLAKYPYQFIEPRTNCYGIALFSRIPFIAVRTITLQGSPFIEAQLAVEGRPVRLLAVHTSSPISYGHFQRRNAQLHALARNVAVTDTPTVVVGDLNTVHWDQAYTRFCAVSGLRPTGGTDHRTWPSLGPFALIPLDHLLISKGVASRSLHTFNIPGSDHRGLLAELRITGHAY